PKSTAHPPLLTRLPVSEEYHTNNAPHAIYTEPQLQTLWVALRKEFVRKPEYVSDVELPDTRKSIRQHAATMRESWNQACIYDFCWCWCWC
ncbi:MAG: hypothetical protein ACK56I_12225, partial [bacterium]